LFQNNDIPVVPVRVLKLISEKLYVNAPLFLLWVSHHKNISLLLLLSLR